MAEITSFQTSYTKQAIRFWMNRPNVLRAQERFAKNPFAVEVQFEYEITESLKDVCFNLTDRLHDYDNDVEVRTGQDRTHRVLYICNSVQEAESLVLTLRMHNNIRVHELY